MDLTLQRPGDNLFIRAISDEGICIVNDWYRGPVILSAIKLITDWGVTNIDELSELLFEPVFELSPDIVLIGTGAQQSFLPAELMMVFYRRGIGVEVMATAAACRTFNVLVSEERRIVAALMPIETPSS